MPPATAAAVGPRGTLPLAFREKQTQTEIKEEITDQKERAEAEEQLSGWTMNAAQKKQQIC